MHVVAAVGYTNHPQCSHCWMIQDPREMNSHSWRRSIGKSNLLNTYHHVTPVVISIRIPDGFDDSERKIPTTCHSELHNRDYSILRNPSQN